MKFDPRSYLLGTVSSLALAGVVNAQPVTQSWTGFYVGVNGGALWHHWDFNDANNGTFNGPLRGLSYHVFSGNKAALTLGGQVGHNWQVGAWIWGLEGDLNWSSAKASTTFPQRFGGTITASTRLDWLATLRGRVGTLFSPTTMVYVTGGLALAHVQDTFRLGTFPAGTEPAISKVLAGYAIGGGVEHMFSPNWTAKAEALFVGFQKASVTNQRFGNNFYRSEFKHSAALFRLGVNRRLQAN